MLMFGDVRICFVAVKVVHTACAHNILPDSLFSDVLMYLNGFGV